MILRCVKSRRKKDVLELTEDEKEQLRQWNERLTKEGLSVEKGRSRKLIYVGHIDELNIISGYGQTDSGRVTPEKAAE